MKGKITGIEILDKGQVTERIQFDVLVDTLIDEDDAQWQDFDLLSNNGVDESEIRFVVNKLKNVDDALKAGKIKDITKYLNKNIHVYGGAYNSFEVIKRLTGKELSAKPLINYFKKKYDIM